MTTSNNNTTKLSFSNGYCNGRTGFRRIIIDAKTGKVRPVLAAKRSGYMPDRCTIQTASSGDVIIRVDYNNQGMSLFSQTVVSTNSYDGEHLASYTEQKGKEKFPSGISNFRFFLEAINLELPDEEVILMWEFLNFQGGRQSSFLPAGLGWNGVETLGDMAKKRRLSIFLEGLPKDIQKKIIRKAMVAKREDIPTNWEEAGILPARLHSPAKTLTGSLVDIDQTTAWILIYENGKKEYHQFEATSGPWGSNYAHSDSGEYAADPVPTPKDVVKAIRLTFGAYTKDHHSYGIKWALHAIRDKFASAVPSISGELKIGQRVLCDGGMLYSIEDYPERDGIIATVYSECSHNEHYFYYSINF